jgi:hypothetical protein
LSAGKKVRHRPRKRGRKKRWKLTPARAAANRVRAWKHGLRAQVVTQKDVLRALFARLVPGGPEVAEAYVAAMEHGDSSGLNEIAVVAMSQSELVRREVVREIRERGVLVEDDLVNSEGEAIGKRIKANPLLEPLRHFDERLGHTAEQLQLTRKSRGEGAVNAALAFRLQRDAQLRALDYAQRRLPPPPESFDRRREGATRHTSRHSGVKALGIVNLLGPIVD